MQLSKKSSLLISLLLSLTFLACEKKKEEETKSSDTGSQVEIPVVTTTSTTLPTVTTTTTTTSTTTSTSTTTTTLPPSAGFDVFKDVAYVVGEEVDKVYSEYRELLTDRGSGYVHKTDSCDPQLKGQSRFADQIAYYVQVNTVARKAKLDHITDTYYLPKDTNEILETSLISHAMCEVSAETLKTTLGASKVPSSKVIAQANDFAKKYNSLRTKIQKGDKSANLEMNKLWSRMNMCLSYVGALTTADSSSSEKIAQKYAPKDYTRPPGVLFYEDPKYPGEVTRLNLGLYQFSPDSAGNILPCIQQWNAIYPTCQIPTNGDPADMIRLLGSSYQSFNAFCGTEKPVESFSVQVNTSSARKTHPANVAKDGTLLAPENRCVSLHFQSGMAYNHFGPYRNSTDQNLEELLTCALTE